MLGTVRVREAGDEAATRFTGLGTQLEVEVTRPAGSVAAIQWISARTGGGPEASRPWCAPSDADAVRRELDFWGVPPEDTLRPGDPLHLHVQLREPVSAWGGEVRPLEREVERVVHAPVPTRTTLMRACERPLDRQHVRRSAPPWVEHVLRMCPDIVLGGGGALALATCSAWEPADWDLYAVGVAPHAALEEALRLALSLLPASPPAVCVNTARAVTLVTDSARVQFVRTAFDDLRCLFRTIDLDCCRVALRGGEFFTDARGEAALARRTNVVNWRTWSEASVARALKYASRGYALELPGLDRAAPAWPCGVVDGASPVDRLLCFRFPHAVVAHRRLRLALDTETLNLSGRFARSMHDDENSGGAAESLFKNVQSYVRVCDRHSADPRQWLRARCTPQAELVLATDVRADEALGRHAPFVPRPLCRTAEEFFRQDRSADLSGTEVNGYIYAHHSRVDVLLSCERKGSTVLWRSARSLRCKPLLLHLEGAAVTQLDPDQDEHGRARRAIKHDALARVAELLRPLAPLWCDQVASQTPYQGEFVCALPEDTFTGALTVSLKGTEQNNVRQFRRWKVVQHLDPWHLYDAAA